MKMMNYIKSALPLLMLCFLMSSCLLSKKAAYPALNDYENGKDYTAKTIRIPGILSKAVISSQLKKEDEMEMRMIARRLGKTKIVIIESNNPVLLQQVKNDTRNIAGEEWLRIRHENSQVSLNVIERKDAIRKIHLSVLQPGSQSVIVDVKCKLKFDELSRLIEAAAGNREEMLRSITSIELKQ